MKVTIPLLILLLASVAQGQEKAISGVTMRTWLLDADVDRIPTLVADQTPNVDVRRTHVDFDRADFPELEGATYTTVTGELKCPEPGSYRFRLTSDDGARLSIGGRVICDHDGRHGATPKESKEIELSIGAHPLLIEHFDAGGNRRLLLEWRRPDEDAYSPVPESALQTENDPTRVTSPGPKRIRGMRRPGNRRPLRAVHPGWRVETIRPGGFEPKVGAMAFLLDGRLLVGTFDPLQRDEIRLPDISKKKPDVLYAISGLSSSDPADWKIAVAAQGLLEPAGACVVGDDVYVSQRGRITRLQDRDGDGIFEQKKDVAAGWDGWNYHQFTMSVLHRDGKLYATLSTAMAPPNWEGMGTNAAPNGPLQGSVIEVDLASDSARVIAGGLRSPNGLGFGPEGSLFYADNQGTWMSTSQFAEIIPGRFYGHFNRTNLVPKLLRRFPMGGHPSAYCDRLRTPPAAWLPQNDVVNSPSQSLLIPEGPFASQMLLGELTAGGIRRLYLEQIKGQWQGALFRFTQGLEAGVNRMTWGPDGALYVGGMGAGGNWNWRGKQFGLQRLVPTGKSTFEMRAIRALPAGRGFEIEFTDQVSPEWLSKASHFELQQWRYVHTKNYGGPKVDVEELRVTAARPSPDGRRVQLSVQGLREGRCVHFVLDPVSTRGEKIWSTEAWYTLNHFPPAETTEATIADVSITSKDVGLGVLPPAHATPLFSRSRFTSFKSQPAGSIPNRGSRSQDDLMALRAEIQVNELTGDLLTEARFGDCRLHVEWFAPKGGQGGNAGNSGLYVQNRYEIQVLSTPKEKETLESWEAGSIYRQKAPDRNASRGPGAWQAYDLWFRAPRFEDGKKTADARMTLYWNGVLVHDDVAVPGPTGARAKGGENAGAPVQLGPLLLQNHSNNAEGPVRYRNLWIAELSPPRFEEGPWRPLFTGEGFEGFRIVGGKATFERKKNEIIGRTRPNTPNTFLTTDKEYADFDLLFDVKVDAELNSGVQIRSEDIGRGLRGYQVEIDPSPRRYTAGIYEERARGWLFPLLDVPHARRAWKPGAWNRVEVRARGPRIQTWLNGVPAADLFDAARSRGHIGFQVHGVGSRERPLEVRWRKVRIRELKRLP